MFICIKCGNEVTQIGLAAWAHCRDGDGNLPSEVEKSPHQAVVVDAIYKG